MELRRLVFATYALASAMVWNPPAVANPVSLALGGIAAPDWATWTSATPLDSFYPARAHKLGVSGQAILHCRVGGSGDLSQCAVTSESPATFGFGDAALMIARHLRVKLGSTPIVNSFADVKLSFFKPSPGARSYFPIIAAPTRAQVAAAYPHDALGGSLGGKAVMRCKISPTGSLDACAPLSENPAGLGYGRAGLSLSPFFKVQINSANSDTISTATVDVPVTFHNPSFSSGPPRITNPSWIQMISYDYFNAAYPANAIAAGIDQGSAQIQCVVAASGHLTGCQVRSEFPKGLGFGEAAIKIAGQMVMSPWTPTGEPVEGATFVIPQHFERRPTPQPAPKA